MPSGEPSWFYYSYNLSILLPLRRPKVTILLWQIPREFWRPRQIWDSKRKTCQSWGELARFNFEFWLEPACDYNSNEEPGRGMGNLPEVWGICQTFSMIRIVTFGRLSEIEVFELNRKFRFFGNLFYAFELKYVKKKSYWNYWLLSRSLSTQTDDNTR